MYARKNDSITLKSHCFKCCVLILWFILVLLPLQSLYANTIKVFTVVSLSPNTTAIIHDVIEQATKENAKAEINTKLIGSIYYTGQPKYYENYQNIGSFQALNVEKIISLAPDLVITWAGQTQPQVIALLKRFGIKVAIFNAEDLKSLATTFADIGASIQLKNAGIALQQSFVTQLQAIIKHKATASIINHHKPSVLLQLAMQPIFVAGGSGILNDIVVQCGGVNVFKDIDNVSFQTNINAIVERDPSIIIMLSNITKWHIDQTSMWQRWQDLLAVKNKHVFQLSSDGISQFSPQILTGVKNICDILGAAD
ncbi:ABC transporter substrate-binding protein [Cysteiniphilum sp. QT6929]|uniref:ABC transporter substrate-binding protein n=1 Tax=Cysteiniphilum sp. QT6929 TaxID=2975055 RepID=UPI0024B33C0D|nr:ABC transporter substrate-binding protein [Cysteiniphilum sp. QT6929]WHN65736.1 ABC transporter substrate-binding protein [Cysteiniphilum sp. QT6929]